MPTVARLDMPGFLQHVIVRGVERREIFLDESDRQRFVDRLSDVLIETETLCYAWSLIPNHFHLLLLPTRFKLAVVMRRLLTGYAVTFNLLHDRVGHLFQNRYKSVICDKDGYLLELVRYIHLNPLRAGLVRTIGDLERYRWSGYAVLMGWGKMEGQVTEEVLEYFGQEVAGARKRYGRFVEEGLKMGHRDDLVGGKGERGEGVAGGRDRVDSRILGDKVFARAVLSERRLVERAHVSIGLGDLVKVVSSFMVVEPILIRRPGKRRSVADARGVVSYVAIRELGYKGKEVGKELNLGPSGVSIALRRGETFLAERQELKEQILQELEK
jgi:putative transposase